MKLTKNYLNAAISPPDRIKGATDADLAESNGATRKCQAKRKIHLIFKNIFIWRAMATISA